jgi:hypothetical protein
MRVLLREGEMTTMSSSVPEYRLACNGVDVLEEDMLSEEVRSDCDSEAASLWGSEEDAMPKEAHSRAARNGLEFTGDIGLATPP